MFNLIPEKSWAKISGLCGRFPVVVQTNGTHMAKACISFPDMLFEEVEGVIE